MHFLCSYYKHFGDEHTPSYKVEGFCLAFPKVESFCLAFPKAKLFAPERFLLAVLFGP